MNCWIDGWSTHQSLHRCRSHLWPWPVPKWVFACPVRRKVSAALYPAFDWQYLSVVQHIMSDFLFPARCQKTAYKHNILYINIIILVICNWHDVCFIKGARLVFLTRDLFRKLKFRTRMLVPGCHIGVTESRQLNWTVVLTQQPWMDRDPRTGRKLKVNCLRDR